MPAADNIAAAATTNIKLTEILHPIHRAITAMACCHCCNSPVNRMEYFCKLDICCCRSRYLVRRRHLQLEDCYNCCYLGLLMHEKQAWYRQQSPIMLIF